MVQLRQPVKRQHRNRHRQAANQHAGGHTGNHEQLPGKCRPITDDERVTHQRRIGTHAKEPDQADNRRAEPNPPQTPMRNIENIRQRRNRLRAERVNAAQPPRPRLHRRLHQRRLAQKASRHAEQRCLSHAAPPPVTTSANTAGTAATAPRTARLCRGTSPPPTPSCYRNAATTAENRDAALPR